VLPPAGFALPPLPFGLPPTPVFSLRTLVLEHPVIHVAALTSRIDVRIHQLYTYESDRGQPVV